MNSGRKCAPDVSTALQSVTSELRRLQDLLMLPEKLDSLVLTEFRDVLNRVRHTAWAVHQYGQLIADGNEPNHLGSILAGERVRTICQLCKALERDFDHPEIHFHKGQLLGLYTATQQLGQRLCDVTEN